MSESPYIIDAEDEQELVDLLLDCDRREEFWDTIIAELPKGIGVSVLRGSTVKERVFNLLKASQNYPRGIETLLSRVRYRTDRSFAWHRLAKSAFGILCRLPAEFQNLGDRLVDLVEAINPNRRMLCQVDRDQLDNGGSFANGFEAILILFQRPDRSQAIDFIGSIARHEYSGDRSIDLQYWLAEAAKALGIQLQERESTVASTENYLMIQVQPVAADRFKLYRWVQIEGRPRLTPHDTELTFTLEQLFGEIEETASWVLNQLTPHFVLELFVKRSIFCQDVTKWEVKVGGDSSRLVYEAPIILRCLERLEARMTELKDESRGLSAIEARMEAWKRSLTEKGGEALPKEFVNLAAWREKSAALFENREKEVEAMLEHITDNAEGLDKKRDVLAKTICVGLGFVPAPAQDGKDALSTAINRGAPVAIWFRDLPSGGGVDKKTFVKMLRRKKTRIRFRELREHLWELRKKAVNAAANDDIYQHLSVLYDEYDRIPPPPVCQPPE